MNLCFVPHTSAKEQPAFLPFQDLLVFLQLVTGFAGGNVWQEEEQKTSHLPCFLTNETTKRHGHAQYKKAPVFNEHETLSNFGTSAVSTGHVLTQRPVVERSHRSLWHVYLCLVEKDSEKGIRGDREDDTPISLLP